MMPGKQRALFAGSSSHLVSPMEKGNVYLFNAIPTIILAR